MTRDGSDDAERPPPWICFSPRPSATPPSCKPARATTRARARASSRSSTSTTARSSCATPRSRSCRRLSSPRLRSRTRATSRPPRSTRAPRAGEYPIQRDRDRDAASAAPSRTLASPRSFPGVRQVAKRPKKAAAASRNRNHPIDVGRFVPPRTERLTRLPVPSLFSSAARSPARSRRSSIPCSTRARSPAPPPRPSPSPSPARGRGPGRTPKKTRSPRPR